MVYTINSIQQWYTVGGGHGYTRVVVSGSLQRFSRGTSLRALGTIPRSHGKKRNPAPVQTAPVQTDPVQTDPVQTDPVQTDPAQIDPVKISISRGNHMAERDVPAQGWTAFQRCYLPFSRRYGVSLPPAATATTTSSSAIVDMQSLRRCYDKIFISIVYVYRVFVTAVNLCACAGGRQ